MSRQKDKKVVLENEQATGSQRRIELLTGLLLFAFGVYHSILYFGHTVVPISDFPDFFRQGRELLSGHMPSTFKFAPVLGLLQNLISYFTWEPTPDLTAGWLLNAILHPFTVVLLWLVGKRIIGRSAVWFAVIVSINPWTIYMLTEPIIETPFLFFILLTIYLIFIGTPWAYLAASITTMVRYEGAALILAAFVADVIHRKNRRDIIRAIVYSAIAALPLMIWMTLTVANWGSAESAHYLNVFFSKEYAKGFVEPKSGRTGIGLHLQLLWQVAFAPLLLPYPGSSVESGELAVKLFMTAAAIGFLLGCVFAIFKKQWEVLILLLFFTPYFVLHAYYPYPLTRFHSTVFWVAMLIAWFGLASAGGLLVKKNPLPRPAAILVLIIIAAAAAIWCISLVKYFPAAAKASSASATIPYITILLVVLVAAMRFFAGGAKTLPRNVCAVCVLCLVTASNQFPLARLLGDGKREIEFKQLGEWFNANAGENEKMAVYTFGPAQIYASKKGKNIVPFPKSDSPKDLAEKLRQQGITYVVWATREGFSHGEHTGYQQLGLNKNIAFLDKPRSIGCYEFITPIGSERGFVYVFRLLDKGDEQLPAPGN